MNSEQGRPSLAGSSGTRLGVQATGLLGKALALASGAVLLILGLMFSLLVFAIAATGGLAVVGYLWWKTRGLRRRIRENPPGGRVIEGEVIRDDTTSPHPSPPKGGEGDWFNRSLVAGDAIDIQKVNIASSLIGRRFDQRR